MTGGEPETPAAEIPTPIDALPPAAETSQAAPPRPRLWTLGLVWVALLAGIVMIAGVAWFLAAIFFTRPEDGGSNAAIQRMLSSLDTLPGLIVTAAVSSLWFGLLALAAAAFSPVPFIERLRLARPHLPVVGWVLAIVGGLAVSEGADAFLTWTGLGRGETLEQMEQVLRLARGPMLALAVLTIGLLAGTAEELFFRGYMQSRLVQRLGPFAGIAIASVMFAVAHLDPRHSFFALTFGGFVGWVAWRTGSVWPGVAIHIVNNSLSTLTSAAGWGEAGESRSTGAVLFAVSMAVLLGAILGLRRLFRRGEPDAQDERHDRDDRDERGEARA